MPAQRRRDREGAGWRFSHALMRRPADSAVEGLREVDRGAPSIEALRAQHAAYAVALEAAGVAVDIQPALADYPDSLFVEDTALTLPEGAILLRLAAPSRAGEVAEIAPALEARFGTVGVLPGEGFVDGGDVMVTPEAVFIGLSARTDRAGAEALAAVLGAMGYAARIVVPPPGALHLKTASALVAPDTVLATEPLARAGLFGGLRVVEIPAGEEAAANALRINDTVLIAAGHPRTRDLLAGLGLDVVALDVGEAARLDAGLSCMSLRW